LKNKYILLDSGDFQKLELIDGYKIIRPSLNSPYPKTNPKLWQEVDAVYTKNDRGSGDWQFFKKIPENLYLHLNPKITCKVKFTPFGHLGIFPEQTTNWQLLLKLGKQNPNLEVLNLFAYSGISTLYCLKANMSVCHVDASKGMVEWARENAELSNLSDKKVRWIVDDVIKFVKREIKRGKKYNGFILDPPTFGRGAKGEVWKIEEGLIPLIQSTMELCNFKPQFVFLSCHTSGFSANVIERILQSFIQQKGRYQSGELFILEQSGKKLSGGFYTNFLAEDLQLTLE